MEKTGGILEGIWNINREHMRKIQVEKIKYCYVQSEDNYLSYTEHNDIVSFSVHQNVCLLNY